MSVKFEDELDEYDFKLEYSKYSSRAAEEIARRDNDTENVAVFNGIKRFVPGNDEIAVYERHNEIRDRTEYYFRKRIAGYPDSTWEPSITLFYSDDLNDLGGNTYHNFYDEIISEEEFLERRDAGESIEDILSDLTKNGATFGVRRTIYECLKQDVRSAGKSISDLCEFACMSDDQLRRDLYFTTKTETAKLKSMRTFAVCLSFLALYPDKDCVDEDVDVDVDEGVDDEDESMFDTFLEWFVARHPKELRWKNAHLIRDGFDSLKPHQQMLVTRIVDEMVLANEYEYQAEINEYDLEQANNAFTAERAKSYRYRAELKRRGIRILEDD
jgi:hypothetical protein